MVQKLRKVISFIVIWVSAEVPKAVFEKRVRMCYECPQSSSLGGGLWCDCYGHGHGRAKFALLEYKNRAASWGCPQFKPAFGQWEEDSLVRLQVGAGLCELAEGMDYTPYSVDE